jgi:hypothetical protein
MDAFGDPSMLEWLKRVSKAHYPLTNNNFTLDPELKP